MTSLLLDFVNLPGSSSRRADAFYGLNIQAQNTTKDKQLMNKDAAKKMRETVDARLPLRVGACGTGGFVPAATGNGGSACFLWAGPRTSAAETGTAVSPAAAGRAAWTEATNATGEMLTRCRFRAPSIDNIFACVREMDVQ